MRLTRVVLVLAALMPLWSGLAEAQTVASRTTFAANATADDNFITVTSNTGFTVGNQVWADFEQMTITSISGTRIGVRRGQNGTRAQAHDNTDGVITGASAHFHNDDPDTGADCTRGAGQAAYSPWINTRTGWIWVCDNNITADWSGTLKSHKTVDCEPTSF